jgi:hypothetical protein
MEVTQILQQIQDEACQLFTEIEGRGTELEQVITATEQCLEGPVNEAIIQEFVEQEVEASRAKIEASEEEIPRQE